MNVYFTETGWCDYLYWQTQDKKTLKRINNLVRDIERDGGFDGIGKPEPLQYGLSGLWSRRIDLVEPVGDENDARAPRREGFHHIEELFRFGYGERGGRFIHDKDTRVQREGFQDLRHLSFCHAEPRDGQVGVQFWLRPKLKRQRRTSIVERMF
jgi:toxin YoeB